MKATELMINDWVELAENGRAQVSVTDSIGIMATICEEGGVHTYFFEESDLAPIPLTAEMLEKNGFSKVNAQRWDFGEYESECYVRINCKKGYLYVNGKENHCNIYDAPFVHTLQHALRLCGLNELADNFKV